MEIHIIIHWTSSSFLVSFHQIYVFAVNPLGFCHLISAVVAADDNDDDVELKHADEFGNSEIRICAWIFVLCFQVFSFLTELFLA